MEKTAKNYSWILGVSLSVDDVSACLISVTTEIKFTKHFSNNMTGLHALKSWVAEYQSASDATSLCIIESAGHNVQTVVHYLMNFLINVWLISPAQVSRNLAPSRDAEPTHDASQLAMFALLNSERAALVTTNGLTIETLKDLQENHKKISKAILILESGTARLALRNEASAELIEHLNASALKGLKATLTELEEKISYYTFSLKLSLSIGRAAGHKSKPAELADNP